MGTCFQIVKGFVTRRQHAEKREQKHAQDNVIAGFLETIEVRELEMPAVVGPGRLFTRPWV